RRICTAQTTNVCAGLACLVLGYPWGSCRAGCDIFAATSPCPQSNALAPRQICQWALTVNITRTTTDAGTVGMGTSAPGCGAPPMSAILVTGPGMACNSQANPPRVCGQGLVCIGQGVMARCAQVCDSMHACTNATDMCLPALWADPADMTGMTLLSAPGPN